MGTNVLKTTVYVKKGEIATFIRGCRIWTNAYRFTGKTVVFSDGINLVYEIEVKYLSDFFGLGKYVGSIGCLKKYL